MAVDNSKLLYLLDPAFQIENIAGKPAVGGHIEVFYAGTDVKVITKQNFDGVDNPFKVPLNNDGRAVMLVGPGAKYDIYFYDSFNNLIFSRLNVFAQGEGEGSVSGLTQIFHDDTLTGDGSYHDPLGAIEYTGILPIDVNNDLHLISAQTTKLGVQEPLYFVQDDEEMTVIGLSGGIVPEGTMNESAFGFENNKITGYNGSAFSAGNEYEAGNYISIDNNTLSVTGLTPVPADTASTGLVASVSADITAMIPDTSDMATQTWVNEQGFLTAHQDISNKLDTTAFSTVSGDFLTAVPSEYVTENTLQSGLSSKLDSSSFASVSGNFLTAVPEGYATEDWVTGQGYLTAHQSLDGLMSADLLEISDNKITGYNGTAFAGQGGGVSGDYELSAGSGISIVDYPLEQKTVISVTAQGGNPEVEQAVIDNSATWNNVTGKLDNSAVKTAMTLFGSPMVTGISGYYISAGYANYANHDNNGNEITSYYATVDSLTAKQDSLNFGYKDTAISSIDNSALYDNSAHARITTLAGRISDLSSNKLDTTAFSDVSGTFLTAHQDLSDYQTTAGMTAYQPVGDYLTTGDSANFYTTANESGFLTEVPDTYLQNTDLSTTDGKVTAISGIPLSAGGDVPEGVMVESGLEYNAVQEISGYNGSAIAQYGAEKQFIVHDDTLCHLSNSAQFALGVNLSAVAQLLGVDETVLWEGSANTGTLNFTDPLTSFKEFKFYVDVPERGINKVLTFYDAVNTVNPGFIQLTTTTMTTGSIVNDWWQGVYNINATVDTATYKSMSIYANGQYYKQCSTTACGTNASKLVVKKVVGIGRKQ